MRLYIHTLFFSFGLFQQIRRASAKGVGEHGPPVPHLQHGAQRHGLAPPFSGLPTLPGRGMGTFASSTESLSLVYAVFLVSPHLDCLRTPLCSPNCALARRQYRFDLMQTKHRL